MISPCPFGPWVHEMNPQGFDCVFARLRGSVTISTTAKSLQDHPRIDSVPDSYLACITKYTTSQVHHGNGAIEFPTDEADIKDICLREEQEEVEYQRDLPAFTKMSFSNASSASTPPIPFISDVTHLIISDVRCRFSVLQILIQDGVRRGGWELACRTRTPPNLRLVQVDLERARQTELEKWIPRL